MDIPILEDDPARDQVFCDALEDADHTVSVVQTSDDAVALLSNRSYDQLIFDLMVNGETSIPVFDFADFARPDAEVILVTGSGHFPRGEMHYCVFDISYRLQKPIKVSELVQLVAHLERTTVKTFVAPITDYRMGM